MIEFAAFSFLLTIVALVLIFSIGFSTYVMVEVVIRKRSPNPSAGFLLSLVGIALVAGIFLSYMNHRAAEDLQDVYAAFEKDTVPPECDDGIEKAGSEKHLQKRDRLLQDWGYERFGGWHATALMGCNDLNWESRSFYLWLPWRV